MSVEKDFPWHDWKLISVDPKAENLVLDFNSRLETGLKGVGGFFLTLGLFAVGVKDFPLPQSVAYSLIILGAACLAGAFFIDDVHLLNPKSRVVSFRRTIFGSSHSRLVANSEDFHSLVAILKGRKRKNSAAWTEYRLGILTKDGRVIEVTKRQRDCPDLVKSEGQRLADILDIPLIFGPLDQVPRLSTESSGQSRPTWGTTPLDMRYVFLFIVVAFCVSLGVALALKSL